MINLPQRQREALEFIKFFIGEHGYSPTLEDIQKHMGVNSISTVQHHVNALRIKGLIEAQKGKGRTIRVV